MAGNISRQNADTEIGPQTKIANWCLESSSTQLERKEGGSWRGRQASKGHQALYTVLRSFEFVLKQ